jgi:hypothetical protein
VEAGERLTWKDTPDRSLVYKGYRAQSDSLVASDGILEGHWESADGRSKTAETIIFQSKVKEVLGELRGGSSGGHLGINKTLDNVRHRYYWLHARSDVE